MSESSRDRPILRLAVSTVDGADDQRLETALAKIARQDPRIRVVTHPQGRLYSLEGMTESDLESICDRLRDEYCLAINIGKPQAILLETIRSQAETEGKYIRQTGGSGNYGHCWLRVEPNEAGKGYEFIDEMKDGAVPTKYMKSVDRGVQRAMDQGILSGFRLVDMKVTLFDGSYHEADSNEMAFEFAGSIGFKEAAKKANPVLLEPMMAAEIDVPEELTDTIRAVIHKHRGRIERRVTTNGFTEIKAVVPLSEILASNSSELTEFPMEFVRYEAMTDNGSSDESGSDVTANKPNDPRLGSRSATTRWIPEED